MTFYAKLLKGGAHGNRQVAKETHVAFSSFGIRFLPQSTQDIRTGIQRKLAEVRSTLKDLYMTFIYVYIFNYIYFYAYIYDL